LDSEAEARLVAELSRVWLLPFIHVESAVDLLLFQHSRLPGLRAVFHRNGDVRGRRLADLFDVLLGMALQASSVFPQNPLHLARLVQQSLETGSIGDDRLEPLLELLVQPDSAGRLREGKNTFRLSDADAVVVSEYERAMGIAEPVWKTPNKFEEYRRELLQSTEFEADWSTIRWGGNGVSPVELTFEADFGGGVRWGLGRYPFGAVQSGRRLGLWTAACSGRRQWHAMGIVRWSSWRVFQWGGFVGWEQRPFATFCGFCGQPPVIEVKGLTRRREDAKKGGEVGWSAKTDTLVASRLCGLSVSRSGAFSGAGEGSGCWRPHGKEICRPAGAGFMRGRNPALTRWATV